MRPQTLAAWTERLEERVTALGQLPARIDALTLQVSQLLEEMHAEFSAIRTEMQSGDEKILTQARVLHEELISRLALIEESRDRPRNQP
jgi:hypothetical protein